MPNPDAVREFLNDWAVAVTALLGAIATFDKARQQLRRWWDNLNLWGRMRKVEAGLDELTSVAHIHEEAQP